MTAPTTTTLPATRPGSQVAPPPRRQLADHEFLAPALEILETPPSPVRMSLIVVICAFVAAVLAWAYLGRLDMVASAQGKIQPVGRVKVVQPLESGIVSRILAVNGSHVEKGQALIELDPAETLAEVKAAQLGLASLSAEATRRRAAIAAAENPHLAVSPVIAWNGDVTPALREREERTLAADTSELRASVEALMAQQAQKQLERDQLIATMATQQQLIATLQRRVDMRSELIRHQAGTAAALIDATETLQYQETQLALQKGQLMSAEGGMSVAAKQAEKARQDFIADNAQKLGDAERQVEDFTQRLAKAHAKLTQLTLTAPLAGTVQASVATNPGQVLASGQEVMRIVPDGATLEAEVYVLNRDIAFVKADQDAIIKVEAFPFTRYGVIKAHVTHIASDAIPEPDVARMEGDPARGGDSIGLAGAQRTQNLVFPVRLRLAAAAINVDGRPVPLASGMSVVADMQTGRRRILEYLFSPLVEVGSDALRER